MERSEALERLPQTYRVLLNLLDDGIATPELARRAGVAADALPALLTLAHAKLAHLMREPSKQQEQAHDGDSEATTAPRENGTPRRTLGKREGGRPR